MINVLIHHKVKDYKTWKSSFDSFSDVRKANGELSFEIFQINDDPNNLTLMFEWDSLSRAQTFLGLPELKEKMMQAGVLGPPEISFFNKVAQGSV